MMDLSIIIVSFNTRELTKKCLASVFASLENAKLKVEVIVVDNGSKDASTALIKRQFASVTLLEYKENLGFGRANNQAARLAKGVYLLFLNSDTEVLDGAIEQLYSFAKTREKKVIFGGKLFNTDRTPQSSCGHFYTLKIVLLSLFLKGDQLHLTRFSPDNTTETDWVSGACLMIKRDNFKVLGGFDEDIFMYMDEVELCYRAKKQGFKVLFYPGAHFIHVGSASSADKRAPYANLFRGLMYFYKKHWPGKLGTLKLLLNLKALIAINMGKVLRKKSLVDNYQRAFRIVSGFDNNNLS